MTSLIDRPDIDVSEKVHLYNQTLLRYNEMTKTRANKPTRVVVVNEEKAANEDNDEENDTLSEIVATMPKSLQLKAGYADGATKEDGRLERPRQIVTCGCSYSRKQHNRTRSPFSANT